MASFQFTHSSVEAEHNSTGYPVNEHAMTMNSYWAWGKL